MHQQPMELTYEIELAPGEKLELPQTLIGSVGPGRWMITVQALPPRSSIRDHAAFLHSYGPEDEGLYDDCAAR